MPKTSHKSEATITSFTVDADASGLHEMPGVTKLLNRKKLENTNSYTKSSPPPFSHPHTASTPPAVSIQLESVSPSHASSDSFAHISLSLEPAETAPNESTVVLSTQQISPSTSSTRRVRPKSASRAPSLRIWDISALGQSADPFEQALVALQRIGVTDLLMLEASSEEPLQMTAKSALTTNPLKLALWKGICWNMLNFADLWQDLLASGKAEFSSSNTVTQIHSTRNLLRTSLGLGSQTGQHLTLLRVGGPSKVRGVLALVSPTSLQTIPEAVASIQNSES